MRRADVDGGPMLLEHAALNAVERRHHGDRELARGKPLHQVDQVVDGAAAPEMVAHRKQSARLGSAGGRSLPAL